MNTIEKNEAERRLRDQRNAEQSRHSSTVTALREISGNIDAMAGELARLTQERDALLAALQSARETIHAWHGEVAWPEYQHSPEMKRINTALALCGKGAQ